MEGPTRRSWRVPARLRAVASVPAPAAPGPRRRLRRRPHPAPGRGRTGAADHLPAGRGTRRRPRPRPRGAHRAVQRGPRAARRRPRSRRHRLLRTSAAAQAALGEARDHVRAVARGAWTGDRLGALEAMLTSRSADELLDRVEHAADHRPAQQRGPRWRRGGHGRRRPGQGGRGAARRRCSGAGQPRRCTEGRPGRADRPSTRPSTTG